MVLVHPAIDPERKEFRLLRIHPRYPSTSKTAFDVSESTPICCDLFVASRDTAPEYQALSYVWGNVDNTAPIQVNSYEYRIRLNLYLALEHLREEHDSVVIWIDAICIDQGNNEEKNEQVLHMTDIYSSAKCTIAWLGPSADGSDQFLERCTRVGGDLGKRRISDGTIICRFSDLTTESCLLPRKNTVEQERYEYLEKLITRELWPFFDEALRDIPSIIAFVAAYHRFLSRDYWERVWVWQEFVVSTNVVLQCGHSKIAYPEFSDSMYFLDRMQIKVMEAIDKRRWEIFDNSSLFVRGKMGDWMVAECPDDNNDADLTDFKNAKKDYDTLVGLIRYPSMAICGTRRAYQNPQKEDGEDRLALVRILASVFVHGRAQATDARDCVFALFGIAKDTNELGLVANYDGSISDITVFTKAAHAIIAAGHVDLLSLVQHRPHSNTREKGEVELPSWVPDWLNPINRPGGQAPWDTNFAASGNESFEKSPDFEGSSFDHLELLGWEVDTIEETSPAWIYPDVLFGKNNHNTKKYLDNITELCYKSNAKYGSTGYDIYSPGTLDRQSAHFLIPIADQEMNEMGFLSRASEFSPRQAHLGLLSALSSPKELSTESSHYHGMMRYQHFRRPFLSETGFVGLAPETTEKGDVLVIFCGAKFPYALRRTNHSNGEYKFVERRTLMGLCMSSSWKVQGKERSLYCDKPNTNLIICLTTTIFRLYINEQFRT